MKHIDAHQFNSLIKRLAARDETAMDDFFKEYGKLIHAAASPIVKSFIASEVVDDVMLKIWNIADRIAEIDKPLGWLLTVSKNCAKDRLRKEPRVRYVYEARKENDFDKIDSDAQFYDYISILKEDDRKILILKFIQNLEFHEIAKELDMPLSSVTSRFYRANDKIEKKFFPKLSKKQ